MKGLLDAWDMLTGIGEAAAATEAAPVKPVPFTLITGFLGAGKTTLLGNLLADPGGRRLAVLVNDFGDVSVDASLIRARTPSAIELTNGCACCSLSAGLAKTLASLLTADDPPDAILMEASGVADPFGVLQVALSRPGIELEAVIAVVDAETIARQLQKPLEGPVIARQVSVADLVLLNKADLVSLEVLEAARIGLRKIAPEARVVRTVKADAPRAVLFGAGLMKRGPLAAPRRHYNPFHTWTWRSKRALDASRLRAVLDAMPVSVLRAKGFVFLSSAPRAPHLLQVVGRRWSLTPNEQTAAEAIGEIVFIGEPDSRAEDALREALDICRV